MSEPQNEPIDPNTDDAVDPVKQDDNQAAVTSTDTGNGDPPPR